VEEYSGYVGLDVHKDTIVVAIAYPGRSKPKSLGIIAHTKKSLLRLIAKVSPNGEVVGFCYEASSCGYEVEHVDAVKQAESRVKSFDQELRRALAGWSLRPVVESLMALRGVNFVTAMSVLTELGDISRFESPRQLMGYLGLVPSEHSSGGKAKRGGITKTGNGRVRRVVCQNSNNAGC